jgi:Tfp pilus assembly protein PilO
MNKKNSSAIVSLILLLALVGVGVFWLKPNWDEVTALKVTEQARQAAKDEANKTLESLKQAQATLEGSSEIDRSTVLTAIPENFEQDKLINLITDIARRNDVNVGSISFSIPFGSQDAIKKATISLSMTGSEGDLLRLLKGLETSSRKMLVKSVTVQFGRTEGLERINFNISMDTYFQGGI